MKLRLLLLASLLLTAGLSVVACGDDQTVDTSGQPPVQVNLLASLSFMAEIVASNQRSFSLT